MFNFKNPSLLSYSKICFLLFFIVVLTIHFLHSAPLPGGSSCLADFSYQTDTSCGVQFKDLSTYSGSVSYYWNFGDGNTSSVSGPYHVYASSGIYLVVLSIFNNDSLNMCYDTEEDSLLVNCSSSISCQADYSYQADTSCGVQFTDLSSYSGTVYYSWSFGDGNYSWAQNPYHTYSSSGVYNVALTIWDSSGCNNTQSKSVAVTCGSNSGCIADFSYQADTSCGVQFTDLSSNASSYYWSFGDGNYSSAMSPYHAYSSSGNYYVLLEIWDATQSCKDTEGQYVQVTCNSTSNCVADFFYQADSMCGVQFTDLSTGSVSPFFYWNFGDGSTSYTQNPYHVYSSSGNYFVILMLWDSSGCSDTIGQYVQVTCGSNYKCDANFSYQQDSLCFISFTNLSSYSGTVNFIWYFGDLTTSTAVNPYHIYASSGNYWVTLIMYSADSSCYDTIGYSVQVTCGSNTNCEADFTFLADTSCGVQFTNTSSYTGFVNFMWNFGDLTISSDANPYKVYASSGNYWVTLFIYNGDSLNPCADTVGYAVQVNCGSNGIENVTGMNKTAELLAYPNPFGNDVSLTYTLHRTEPVRIIVHNALGQVTENLFEGRQEPGMHKINWNASHLPRGVYAVELLHSGVKETKIVVKQ